jgi:hypothetical protein
VLPESRAHEVRADVVERGDQDEGNQHGEAVVVDLQDRDRPGATAADPGHAQQRPCHIRHGRLATSGSQREEEGTQQGPAEDEGDEPGFFDERDPQHPRTT